MSKKIFNRIQEMCDMDMDIQCSTTMLQIDKCKQGAILQVGVDEGSINKLASNDYMFFLLIVNKEQLNELNKE